MNLLLILDYLFDLNYKCWFGELDIINRSLLRSFDYVVPCIAINSLLLRSLEKAQKHT